MPDRLLLAQLSDLHLCEEWEGVDPVSRVERVVEAVRSLPDRVDAVLVSGDLTDDASEEGYRLARELLGRFEAPVHVLPGNHDDRARLREVFGLPGMDPSSSPGWTRSWGGRIELPPGPSPPARFSPLRAPAFRRGLTSVPTTSSSSTRPASPCTFSMAKISRPRPNCLDPEARG
jgi:hypothetical protein